VVDPPAMIYMGKDKYESNSSFYPIFIQQIIIKSKLFKYFKCKLNSINKLK